MSKLWLVVSAFLLASVAQGQDMLKGHTYAVDEVSVMRHNAQKHKHQFPTPENRFASYLLLPMKGGLQLRQYLPYSAADAKEVTMGKTVAQFTNIKYLGHKFIPATGILESYLVSYKAFGELIPPKGIPNPCTVEVVWSADNDGKCRLELCWFFGPEVEDSGFFKRSFYSYTLYCER